MTENQTPHESERDLRKANALVARFVEGAEGWQRTLAQRPVLRLIYRIALIVVSVLIIIAGILMLVLPGPGWLTIFLGLALLGSEFAWARRVLVWLQQRLAFWLQRLRVIWSNFRNRGSAKDR